MNVLALLVVLSLPTDVDGPPEINWLSGKSLARSKQLAISVRWQDVPVRSRLVALSHRQGIPIFLDRRIDPDQPLNLDLQQKTWEQVLWETAAQLELEVCQLDELYYFSPQECSIPIRVAYEHNRDQLKRNRKRLSVPWLKPVEFEVRPFDQPRQRLEDLARRYDVSVKGLDKLPLDVWPGWRLPKTDLLQQFTLLLSGFGLYPSISADGKTVMIEAIPAIETAQLRMPFSDRPRAAAEALGPQFEQLSIKPYSQGLIVEGPIDEMVRLQAELVARQTAVVGEKTKKDFTVTASRGQILATMASQLGVKMVLQTGTRPQLESQVTLRLMEATEKEVIQKALEGTGLTFQLTDDQLKITRQKN